MGRTNRTSTTYVLPSTAAAHCGRTNASVAVSALVGRANSIGGLYDMSLTPTTAATARHNLARRIERLLDKIGGEAREADDWEGERLLRALGHLKAGSYSAGEQDMMWGEMDPSRRSAQMMANMSTTDEPPTAAELRARLVKIVHG